MPKSSICAVIRPLDEEAILASVRKTHRAVCVEENKPFCGVSAQIASMIQEKCFDDLDAPVLARHRARCARDLQPEGGGKAASTAARRNFQGAGHLLS